MPRSVFLPATLAMALAAGPVLAQELPTPLGTLGLTDVQVREKPRREYGRTILGTLPGGHKVEIELDGQDRIEEIEARDRDLIPADTLRSLLPAAVLANPSFPAGARLEKIEFERDTIEIDGRNADNRDFDAEFTLDGELIELDVD